MIYIIAAMDANDLIGTDNKLPWYLPNDMKFFKEKTTGQNIVMGRKTFESVGVLPNRKSIVVTRNPNRIVRSENVSTIQRPESILDWEGDYYIIGGAEIYEKYLPYADVMYLTVIDEVFEGDTYFPKWKWDEWKLVSESVHLKDESKKNDFDHTFLKYERIKP